MRFPSTNSFYGSVDAFCIQTILSQVAPLADQTLAKTLCTPICIYRYRPFFESLSAHTAEPNIHDDEVFLQQLLLSRILFSAATTRSSSSALGVGIDFDHFSIDKCGASFSAVARKLGHT